MYNENMLSAVLERDYGVAGTIFTDQAFMNQDLFTYSTKPYKFTGHNINIHNLAHKCKVWAIEQGFNIISHCTYVEVIEIAGINPLIRITNTSSEDNFVAFDPHFDIKACEFVFDTIADKTA